jgi:hypothetical protein
MRLSQRHRNGATDATRSARDERKPAHDAILLPVPASPFIRLLETFP